MILQVVAVVICIVAIFITSYTSGNVQANDLITKISERFDSIPFWEKYKKSLDYVLFWLLPTALAFYAFSYYGLAYLPLVFLLAPGLSSTFFKSQLKKRLKKREIEMEQTQVMWQNSTDIDERRPIEAHLNTAEHKVNELRWIIANLKTAKKLAKSLHGKKNYPIATAAIMVEVNRLDSAMRAQRYPDLNNPTAVKSEPIRPVKPSQATVTFIDSIPFYGLSDNYATLKSLEDTVNNKATTLFTPGPIWQTELRSGLANDWEENKAVDQVYVATTKLLGERYAKITHQNLIEKIIRENKFTKGKKSNSTSNKKENTDSNNIAQS